MIDADLDAILDALHHKKPLRIEETESRIEKVFKKPAKYLLWSSVTFALALGLLALCVWAFDLSPNYWASTAVFLIVASVGTGVLWMIADLLPTLIGIYFYKDDFHKARKLTVIHDLQHARDLHQFDIAALRLTDQWLSLRIERMRLYLGLIIGGADKVALLGLILGAWGIWTNFPGGGITLEQYGYVAFSAFIVGLGGGGVLANVVIKELSYQRDLLSLALSTAPSNA